MATNEQNAIKVLNSALKLPFVKVDRKEFLLKIFNDKTDNLDDLISEGPTAFFSKEELDIIADKLITSEVLKSSSLSFASGLPGGFTMAATIPADLAQFYGYTLRLAQEISYIYGYDNILNENNQLDENGKNTLYLYLGAMFGVTAAGSSVRILSGKASEQILKTLPRKALTKTAYYPIIKKVLKQFGIVLTKKTFSRTVSKVIPVIGGTISGGANYIALKALANKLKVELSKIMDYSESDIQEDLNIVEAEFTEVDIELSATTSNEEISIEDKLNKIKEAHSLYKDGILTEEEFNQVKASLI